MSEVKPVRVGEMLTRAGILRKLDLDEACAIAEETGQMIGKVLIMSGFITKEDLQAAVEAQALVRDGHLELELSFVALSAASRNHITLDQALDQLGWHPQLTMPSARLGSCCLLVERSVQTSSAVRWMKYVRLSIRLVVCSYLWVLSTSNYSNKRSMYKPKSAQAK
ncbi:MAG: hypothetical protein IPJ49_19240 [Candidatus Obscuribacter sp.]|nr:hypothetical protein [Candidatus Obscuribacter sp.]